jgi:hypothetical protein
VSNISNISFGEVFFFWRVGISIINNVSMVSAIGMVLGYFAIFVPQFSA